MDKYIEFLLKNNARLIIPDLGAFITKQDEEKSLFFNEFLKFNDGLLVDHIAEKEKLGKDEATAKVNDFVNSAMQALEKGDKFEIKKLGTLHKDDKGKIHFTHFTSEKPVKKEKADEPFTLDGKPEKTDDKVPKKSPTKESKGLEEVTSLPGKDKVLPGDTLDLIPDPGEKDKPTARPEKEIKKPEKEIKEPVKEVKPKFEKPKEPVEETSPPKKEPVEAIKETKEPEIKTAEPGKVTEKKDLSAYRIPAKKKKGRYYLWGALVLVLAAAVISWFVYFKDIILPDKTPIEDSEQVIAEEQEEPVVTEESVEIAEDEAQEEIIAEPETEIADIEIPVDDVKKYYVVGGCFENEEYADSYVLVLQAKGYNSEKFGKVGRFFAVSYSAFDNRPNAVTELRKIQNEAEPEAWIIYF